MANLETLEVTINGSAESAQTGISGLITSLSTLNGAVGKSVAGLKRLNSELRELKKYGALKLPNLEKISGSSMAKTAKKAMNDYNPLTNNNRAVDVSKLTYPGAVPKEKWERDYAENVRQNKLRLELNRKNNNEYRARIEEEKRLAAEAAKAREQEAISMMKSGDKIGLMKKKLNTLTAEYVNNAREGKLSAKQMANGAMQINSLQEKIQKAEASAQQAPTVFQQLKKGVGNSFKDLTKGATNFFNRVKKIATTMLIRSAIRGLIKSVKEGINNLYEWSKLNNGEFAQSLDKLHAKTAQLKNSIGASIAPVIRAALPAVQALANAAINAFNWVNQLIALLTGQSYWTKAAEGANEYAEAAGGAGKAAKEWLASFDELNVMNNSGGGGGGSGLSGQFDDMFENVTKFDEGIREVADFLKNNFESIKIIALDIGAAILAWKLGNAFADTLPALSELMGFAATGLVIMITLRANWMLTNQYLDTGKEGWLLASMLTTAVGSTAAWAIANKLIGGQAGLYAAGITLAFTAASDIIANIQHTDVSAFSKESVLTNIKAALAGGAAIGILLKATGAAAALGTMGTLVAAGGGALAIFAVATLLKLATQDNTKIEWGNKTLTAEEIDNFVNNQMFETSPKISINLIADNIKEGTVKKEEIQTKLTEMIGTINAIQLGVDDSGTYSTLKTQVEGIVDTVHGYIENAKSTGKLTLQFTPSLVGSDSSSQGNWLSQYTSGWDAVDSWVAEKGKQIGDLLVENEKGRIVAKNPELVQTLMTQLSEVTSAIAEAQIGSEAIANMKLQLGDVTEATGKQIIESFKTYKEQLTESYDALVKDQYEKQGQLVAALGKIDPDSEAYKEALAKYEEMGANLTQAVKDGVASQIQPGADIVMEWLNSRHALGSASSTGNQEYIDGIVRDWKDNLDKALEYILIDTGFEQVEIDAMNLIGVSGWDYLASDTKQKFLNAVQITPETVAELKQVGVSASDLFEFSDWSSFTRQEQFNFITAIKDVYGSEEALAAAKAAGMNVSALVGEGMGSSDSKIREQAQEWHNILQKETGKPVNAPEVKGNKSKITSAGKEAYGWFTDKFKTAVKAKVETTKSNINKIKETIDGAVKQARQVNVTVDGKIADSFVKTLGDKIKTTVQDKLNKVTVKVKTEIKAPNGATVAYAASGGTFSSGQLFIAREAGAELVGSIGNHTAVANNDQIVAGISNGVAAANEEQNALLRQQNQILLGILQKSGSGGLQASSAMGKVIQQSLEMYSAVTGG